VRAIRERELSGPDVTTLRELVDLAEQARGIDHHALREHAARVRAKDAARDQPNDHLVVADHEGVARVGTSREAHDHLCVLGEEVDDLPLPLVTPLRSDNDNGGHGSGY
jgi:hypothetical protein